MRAKFGVIQFPDSIFHVIISQELNNTCSILEHISIADISGLPHVILQVLPAPSRR